MSKTKTDRVMSPMILKEYERDLDAFAAKAKEGIADEGVRDALECLIDFTRRTIQEIKRLKGRITVIKSDEKILRDHFRKEKKRVPGVCIKWR